MDSKAWRRRIGRHQLGRGRYVFGSMVVHQLDGSEFSVAEKHGSWKEDNQQPSKENITPGVTVEGPGRRPMY
ncbi:hypothetical protein HNY73_012873 [Argiope bruennichi]|uniref:Uncharacterized protein n=1 Tax=Argiope bruennichi TaxID=94029 RepID=A0A8T0F0T8_ARGBR|nr:hypothetical protein HNY73_012873 [Argiope bruennichi]